MLTALHTHVKKIPVLETLVVFKNVALKYICLHNCFNIYLYGNSKMIQRHYIVFSNLEIWESNHSFIKNTFTNKTGFPNKCAVYSFEKKVGPSL